MFYVLKNLLRKRLALGVIGVRLRLERDVTFRNIVEKLPLSSLTIYAIRPSLPPMLFFNKSNITIFQGISCQSITRAQFLPLNVSTR